MAKEYTRKGSTMTYTMAEAVAASLTEFVGEGYDDGALERVARRQEAQAAAFGALVQALADVVHPDKLQPALDEIMSYQFTEKAP